MAKKDRSRAPSDDEGVAAVVPASLKGLDDDTVLIVTSFLPECRDVLSLSVTHKCGTHVRFQTFMVGSLLVSYQDHQENTPGRPMCHCTNRVVLKVWRF